MYGFEAASRGLGGLAATAPAGYAGLPRTLMIRPRGSALIGGPPQTGVLLPATGIGDSPPALPVNSTTSVDVPAGRMLPDWRQAFDFHNSPAPWILVAILVLYGWLHVGHRRGRRS
jgi:hypothetical protein